MFTDNLPLIHGLSYSIYAWVYNNVRNMHLRSLLLWIIFFVFLDSCCWTSLGQHLDMAVYALSCWFWVLRFTSLCARNEFFLVCQSERVKEFWVHSSSRRWQEKLKKGACFQSWYFLFFRAQHVVHHSSEYYNLSTATRQSVLQSHFSVLFYLPAALFMHPLVYIFHVQLNTLYQYWIHTELISKLGPLEWVLNTASHHRVHHGSNRYCIDKNYGLRLHS
jgi:hypothetical protein